MARIYSSIWDRLIAHIVIDEHTGCWNWVGPVRRHGGGNRPALSIRRTGEKHPVTGKQRNPVQKNAARLMCEEIHGPAPTPEHEAGHLCEDNWLCANPDHLIWETKKENMARQWERRRREALEHPDNDPEIEVGELAEECPF